MPTRLAAASAVLASGCSTVFAVKEQQQLADELAIVAGTVTTERQRAGG